MARKLVLTILASLAIVALAGCPRQRSIAEINADPSRFHNKEVAVVGTVTDSFGAWKSGIYQIDDGTGTIWVLAEHTGVPSKGARVASWGTIIPTVTFAGQNFVTVLKEQERKHR